MEQRAELRRNDVFCPPTIRSAASAFPERITLRTGQQGSTVGAFRDGTQGESGSTWRKIPVWRHAPAADGAVPGQSNQGLQALRRKHGTFGCIPLVPDDRDTEFRQAFRITSQVRATAPA